MARVVLDTGAPRGWENGSAVVRVAVERARSSEEPLLVPAGVLAQYWRGGRGRQAVVSRLLRGCDIIPMSEGLAREAGMLVGTAGTSDVIDATVAILAARADAVLTSDPRDIRHLLGFLPRSRTQVIHV